MHLPKLWENIESRLHSECPDWQERITGFRQVEAVKDRGSETTWADDDEVFKALLLAVLSAGVDWSIVEERVLPDLDDFLRSELRVGSFLESYSNLADTRIRKHWRKWFKERSATPRWIDQLIRMREAARKLADHSKKYRRAEHYFTRLKAQHGNDPKQVALCIGSAGKYKLPSLGIPLAAEALKNLGFDVAKPDRHVCRAVAAFGLVDFLPGGDNHEPPANTRKIQRQSMAKVEEIAKAAGKPVVCVDNAIWMLGAESGLHLTNRRLAELAGNNQIQRKDPSGLLALLDSWEKDGDAEEQRETLEYLIRALDENRPEGYKLFPPELKGKSW